MAEVTERLGWNVWMELSEQANQSLRSMHDKIEDYNGYPITNLSTAKRLDTFIGASKETGERNAPTPLLRISSNTEYKVIAGDASAVATCALEIGGKEDFFTQGVLSQEAVSYTHLTLPTTPYV